MRGIFSTLLGTKKGGIGGALPSNKHTVGSPERGVSGGVSGGASGGKTVGMDIPPNSASASSFHIDEATMPRNRDASGTSTQKQFTAEDFLHHRANNHVPSDLLHPDKEGLAIVTTEELMEANRAFIEQALDAFQNKQYLADFDRLLVECIRRCAYWMGPLPASKAYHHLGRGGLFTHSLGVALGSLHMSVSKNVTIGSSPRDKTADDLAWQLSCFVGGLLHDIGKVNTTGNVYAYAVDPDPNVEKTFRSSSAPIRSDKWQPMVEGFESWAQQNRVRSYYIDFDIDEVLPHRDFTARYVQTLVPRPILSYIYNSADMIRQQFEDFIRNPESAAKTPIFQVIQDADHLNVVQSIDPRRKPGSIEMISLVLRRFSEFAAEAQWNLPVSPFIYAHVQKKTADGLRYFAMPFFVVNEATIRQFIGFIESKPFLGVKFGERMTELVFNSLETSKIMHRSVEGILPEQVAPEDQYDYIPGSKALVRYKAKRAGIIVNPNDDMPEDAIIEQVVIPISVRIPSTVHLNAPTLAFRGIPTGEAATTLAVAIENGSMMPIDPALRRDPEFTQELDRLVHEDELAELSPDQIEAVKQLAPAKLGGKFKSGGAAPAASGSTRSKADEPFTPREPDFEIEGAKSPKKTPKGSLERQSEPENFISQGREPASSRTHDRAQAGFGPRGAGVSSGIGTTKTVHGISSTPLQRDHEMQNPLPDGQDTEMWHDFYWQVARSIEAGNDPSSVAQLFWAGVWIFLRESNEPEPELIAANGVFGIKAPRIAIGIRNRFASAVQGAQMPMKPLSEFWPSESLPSSAPALAVAFKISKSSTEGTFLQLHPRACEMVEEMLEARGLI